MVIYVSNVNYGEYFMLYLVKIFWRQLLIHFNEWTWVMQACIRASLYKIYNCLCMPILDFRCGVIIS